MTQYGCNNVSQIKRTLDEHIALCYVHTHVYM